METSMDDQKKASPINTLLILLLAYCAASLFHYAHNVVYIDDYPNLPGWITTPRVYVAWLGVTAIGVIGYSLVRLGYWFFGLLTVAVYGVLGLDGLAHYTLAPMAAHTLSMNLTIWLEVVTASLVLMRAAWLMVKQVRDRFKKAA
jgi:hypothetical protein